MAHANLGIQRIHSVEVCVQDAEPWLAYLTRGFGFQLLAESTGEDMERSGTRSRLLRCADVSFILSEKVHAGSSVGHYLARHPEGIRRVNFLVRDLAAAETRLRERYATPIDFIQERPIAGGMWKEFAIATPLDEVEFNFIETTDKDGVTFPDMTPVGRFDPSQNPVGLVGFDHLTANVRTLMPTVAFYERVLGFTRFWNVQFHTEDLRPGVGSGLKSVVMWDEESGVKLATNEPLRPRFRDSQIQAYVDLNRGPGVHHVALQVKDIIAAVDACRARQIDFLRTPRTYYEALPARMTAQNIPSVSPAIPELEKRGVLLDGNKDGYLLQAFCRDDATKADRPHAGPLFLEFIQRCGAQGFGEGNFRALFEAVERQGC